MIEHGFQTLKMTATFFCATIGVGKKGAAAVPLRSYIYRYKNLLNFNVLRSFSGGIAPYEYTQVLRVIRAILLECEMVEQGRLICDAVKIPVIGDGDTGCVIYSIAAVALGQSPLPCSCAA